MSPDVAAWVAESRSKQGLEPRITDEPTLLALAGLLVAATDKPKVAGGAT